MIGVGSSITGGFFFLCRARRLWGWSGRSKGENWRCGYGGESGGGKTLTWVGDGRRGR